MVKSHLKSASHYIYMLEHQVLFLGFKIVKELIAGSVFAKLVGGFVCESVVFGF